MSTNERERERDQAQQKNYVGLVKKRQKLEQSVIQPL